MENKNAERVLGQPDQHTYYNAVLQKYGGEQLGDVLVTVNTIVQSIMLVVTMPLGGISSGTQCILSYNYGAYQMERIKEGIRYIAKVCIGYCVLMFAIAWLFGKYFIFLFNKDAQLVVLAQNALTNPDKKSPTSKTRKWRDELSLLPCYNTSVVI